MDPISALSIATAVVQFINLGVKVVKRLSEYNEAARGDVPRSLVNIHLRLPLLTNALSRIQTESDVSNYDAEIRSILHGVVLGCLNLVRELDEIATKLQPRQGENLTSKLKKVFGSLKNEGRVDDIDHGMQAYIQVLILHRVVDRSEVQVAIFEDSKYFEVKEQRVADVVLREPLLGRLDQSFYTAARGQQLTPEVVVLQGSEKSGKTQLALCYCHRVYESGHFQTVFWLDASDTTTLQRGIESAASAVRRTRAGTTKEKLDFFKNFLAERWHPWLLVLDNYQRDGFGDSSLTSFWPEKGYGAILITTRNRDISLTDTAIKVDPFRTIAEEAHIRYNVTQALYEREYQIIEDALNGGLDVNSYSCTFHVDSGSPLVNVAAELGYIDAVQLFFSRGASLKYNSNMSSVLACAAMSGSAPTMILCLDYEDTTGSPLDDNDYAWAFYRSLEAGNVPILRILLDRRKNRFDEENRRIGEAVVIAAEKGHLEVLRLLLSQGCFPRSEGVKGLALCKAILRLNLDMVKFMVTEAEANPNDHGGDGEPPLYCAVKQTATDLAAVVYEVASFLLSAGALPNLGRSRDERTALHHVASHGKVTMIRLLLDHGADPTVETKAHDQETPLMMAVTCKSPEAFPILTNVKISDPDVVQRYFSRPLFLAARQGDRELALLLFEKNVTESVEEKTGDTPLLISIRHGHTALARMLIRNRVKTTTPDKEGKVALSLAAEKGLDLVVRDLSKASDSPGLEVRDKTGNTPLMLAVQQNHKKTVETLIKLGADRDASNKYGETALDIAEEKCFEDIVGILEEVSLK